MMVDKDSASVLLMFMSSTKNLMKNRYGLSAMGKKSLIISDYYTQSDYFKTNVLV